ncbi:iron reductase [Leuconostoc pseudomesenteroides]|uniref:iron reductase n=1 Tax=Leuconostoc pseudomesenteroides TaxID=33968 RepID=UPI00111E70C7|nr:iron reductase [Leuconostoc pseudomesenteroides]TOZ03789.1 iron reductase [Leuconostoc pseudomesenteroides]
MLVQRKYLLGLAWMTAIFIIPLPFIQTLNAGLSPIYIGERIPILYGTIAYSWMLLAIYIGTKPKWLDRLIGLPSAYMLHGILSLAAITLAFLHKESVWSSGLIKLTGDWSFDIFIGLSIYSLVFFSGWLTSRLLFLLWIKSQLEHIFKHELSVWLHRLNIVATTLVFIHVLLIPYIRQIKSFMAVFLITTLFVFTTYVISLLPRGRKAKVLTNTQMTPNIHQLQLLTREKLLFSPGDYIFLSFPKISGLKEPHPFSVVNIPNNKNEIVLAIRGDGDFTRMVSGVKQLDLALINGGFGQYQTVINDQKPNRLLLIAGGIGIIPLLSLIDGNASIPINVLYSSHNKENLLYPEKFSEWNNRANFEYTMQVGRFNDDQVLSVLGRNKKNLLVLIGGPTIMGRYWIKKLKKFGLRGSQIYYEEFSW